MKFIYSKPFAIFAALLVGTVILLVLQNKGYLDAIKGVIIQAPRPIIQAGRTISLPVKNFFGTLYGLRDVVKENAELHNQLFSLQQRIVLLDLYARENELLKQELGFKEKSVHSLQSCTVLAIDPEGLTDAMQLNCGKQDGVLVGQAVVAQDHLVGKIVYAGENSSTARLLTSPQALIDARVSKTGEDGLVGGSFNSGIVIDWLSQSQPLEKGDIIVTAGINSLIPRNIIIGQVGEVLSHSNDLFKKAAIVSPIRFNDLQYVFVVK